MAYRTPSHLPSLSDLCADLNLTPASLAAHLGVTLRTAQRWMAADTAPRPAMLALYWRSRWGLSAAESHALTGQELAQGLAASLAAENAALRREIARLCATGDFGAANRPHLEPGSLRSSVRRPTAL